MMMHGLTNTKFNIIVERELLTMGVVQLEDIPQRCYV